MKNKKDPITGLGVRQSVGTVPPKLPSQICGDTYLIVWLLKRSHPSSTLSYITIRKKPFFVKYEIKKG